MRCLARSLHKGSPLEHGGPGIYGICFLGRLPPLIAVFPLITAGSAVSAFPIPHNGVFICMPTAAASRLKHKLDEQGVG